MEGLNNIYGTWKMPWGEINRYQRNSGLVHQKFDDSKTSLPVGMASSLFGSLPSFETSWSGTKKGYGVAGNSFVAVVEFGPKIKAKSIVTGGQFFDPSSKHFNDQVSGS
jgi:acyl-homoserine lactone acylase PvdQ